MCVSLKICHSYLFSYCHVFLYTLSLLRTSKGRQVIKVVLNLDKFFGVGVIFVKECKMSASVFLINKAD